MSGMTSHPEPSPDIDPRARALAALDAATVARELVAAEYGKPTGRRDYNLIGELRAAAKMCHAEALVYATLYAGDQANVTHPNIPTTVVVTDNAHDALQAARGVHVLLTERDAAAQAARP